MLAAKRNYTRDNHGLFADLGLARLTAFVPFAERGASSGGRSPASASRPPCGGGSRRASGSSTPPPTSSSPSARSTRCSPSSAPTPSSPTCATRCAPAAAWFVKPDGEMTQFGDSNLEPVPDWAQGQGPGSRAYFGAGFAFVREPGPAGDLGYLAVTDGFHNLTHKHADELSFELFDHGASIVSDTGLYHKDPGEIRDYVVSNRAHSGLVVDGLDLPIADGVTRVRVGADRRRRGRRLVRDRGAQPAPARPGRRPTRGSSSTGPGRALVIVDRPALGPRPHLHPLPAARTPTSSSATATRSGSRSTPPASPARSTTRRATTRPTRTQTRGQRPSAPGAELARASASSCPAGRSPSPTPASTEIRALTIALDADRAARDGGAGRRADDHGRAHRRGRRRSALEVTR